MKPEKARLEICRQTTASCTRVSTASFLAPLSGPNQKKPPYLSVLIQSESSNLLISFKTHFHKEIETISQTLVKV